jgi:hypothetical protein
MIKLTDIVKTIIAEEIDPSEAYNDIDAVQTLIDGKRNLAFVVEKSNNKENWARIQKMIADNGLKAMYVKGNLNNPYIVYTPGSEAKANELKDIAETYDGYLSAQATKEDTIKIGELLGYNYDKIMAYVAKNFPDNVDEARVTPVGMGRILPKEDIKILSNLVDTFGEGNSGFELYEPLSQGYRIEDYCDDENEDSSCAAIKHLLSKYPKGAKFISNELFGYNNFAPGVSPNGKFTELIEIEPSDGTIWISAPYISGDFNGDNYNAGWFDVSGKYYADIKNIDKDGNYIGGNA